MSESAGGYNSFKGINFKEKNEIIWVALVTPR